MWLSSYAPNFMDKIRRMRWLKCQGIKMGNPPCNIWHLMRSMWRIGIKWPCLSPKLMHAYSNRALKNCTSTTMAPACGINRSVLRLMLVISDIEVRLGKREKCLGVHLEDYLFSSLPNASIVSDTPETSGNHHYTPHGLGSTMDHCHCCNNNCVLFEFERLRTGLWQCEKDVADAHCNVTYSALQWARLKEGFEKQNL